MADKNTTNRANVAYFMLDDVPEVIFDYKGETHSMNDFGNYSASVGKLYMEAQPVSRDEWIKEAKKRDAKYEAANGEYLDVLAMVDAAERLG